MKSLTIIKITTPFPHFSKFWATYFVFFLFISIFAPQVFLKALFSVLYIV